MRGFACVMAVLLLGAMPARAGQASLTFSTGQYGLRRNLPREAGIQLELRPSWRWTRFRPVAGILAGSGGGAYVFSGFVFELPLPWGAQLNPGFAPGLVLARGDRDLGSPLEFRSSIELSMAVTEALRIGVSFSHISNGGLTRHNPGVETTMLSFAFAPDG